MCVRWIGVIIRMQVVGDIVLREGSSHSIKFLGIACTCPCHVNSTVSHSEGHLF